MIGQDVILTLVSFNLTLLVFTYLLGDNWLFRFVSYLFIGAAAGVGGVMIIYQVILPRLVWPLFGEAHQQGIVLFVAILLSLMLAARFVPGIRLLSGLPLGLIVGMGAAFVVGGAVSGTLVPQFGAALSLLQQSQTDAIEQNQPFAMVEGLLLLLGTISTLAYFQFGIPVRSGQPGQPSSGMRILSRIGEIFIGITLGAIFAGVFSSSVTALVDRLSFLVQTLLLLF
jgi:hypothetical protein